MTPQQNPFTELKEVDWASRIVLIFFAFRSIRRHSFADLAGSAAYARTAIWHIKSILNRLGGYIKNA